MSNPFSTLSRARQMTTYLLPSPVPDDFPHLALFFPDISRGTVVAMGLLSSFFGHFLGPVFFFIPPFTCFSLAWHMPYPPPSFSVSRVVHWSERPPWTEHRLRSIMRTEDRTGLKSVRTGVNEDQIGTRSAWIES